MLMWCLSRHILILGFVLVCHFVLQLAYLRHTATNICGNFTLRNHGLDSIGTNIMCRTQYAAGLARKLSPLLRKPELSSSLLSPWPNFDGHHDGDQVEVKFSLLDTDRNRITFEYRR